MVNIRGIAANIFRPIFGTKKAALQLITRYGLKSTRRETRDEFFERLIARRDQEQRDLEQAERERLRIQEEERIAMERAAQTKQKRQANAQKAREAIQNKKKVINYI